MTAIVPVLLTNAPIAEVTTMIMTSSRVSFVPASWSILLLTIFASPVWKIPPPTTNKPTIIMTTELENPDSASPGVKMSHSINRISAPTATRSERTLPDMKRTEARVSTDRVTIIGPFTVGLPFDRLTGPSRGTPCLAPI